METSDLPSDADTTNATIAMKFPTEMDLVKNWFDRVRNWECAPLLYRYMYEPSGITDSVEDGRNKQR
jgi:hypothetical protein